MSTRRVNCENSYGFAATSRWSLRKWKKIPAPHQWPEVPLQLAKIYYDWKFSWFLDWVGTSSFDSTMQKWARIRFKRTSFFRAQAPMGTFLSPLQPGEGLANVVERSKNLSREVEWWPLCSSLSLCVLIQEFVALRSIQLLIVQWFLIFAVLLNQ